MVRTAKPNILFILPDQQRPDSLGCYGSTVAMTPTLDWLSRNGVTFDNCYVQNPLCCPSRYSLLTGRYPHSTGVMANWYAPRSDETSFAHALGRAGYSTLAVGKMHLTPWHANFGFDGRIIAESKFQKTCPDDYARFLGKHGHSRRELFDSSSETYKRRLSCQTSILPAELHIDSFVGRSACEFLLQAREPFCLFASFPSPHNPYDPPAPYDGLFKHTAMPPRNMVEGETDRKPREAYDYINSRINTWGFKSDEITEEQRLEMWRHYYSLNTLVDDWLKEIIGVLRARDLYDNTIIIYASDHGDLLGDHGLYYKQCFYEQSVKVPLIVHAPKYFAARRIDQAVELMDVYSTICELARTFEGPGAQSKSLVPLLNGDENRIHEAVFSENYYGRMVRWQNWKFIYYPGKPYGELYDLSNDPVEQINLWDKMDGSYEQRVMKDLLLEWVFTSADPLPLPVRHDHHDNAERQFLLHAGGTREALVQPWYYPAMRDFYREFDFSTEGRLR